MFLLLILYYLPFYCAGQQTNNSFKIIEIPKKISIADTSIKTSLNTQLAKAETKEAAFNIINSSLKSYKNSPVRVRYKSQDEKYSYFIYYVGAAKEASITIVDIKATKELIDESLFKAYQLKMFFSDTIVILDSLKVSIYPYDFNFKIDDYYIVPVDGENIEFPLPSIQKNILLIRPSDLPSTVAQPFKYKIYNRADPEKSISEFYIKVLDDDEINELRLIAGSIAEEEGAKNILQNTASHLQVYIKSRWGKTQFKSIAGWLEKLIPL